MLYIRVKKKKKTVCETRGWISNVGLFHRVSQRSVAQHTLLRPLGRPTSEEQSSIEPESHWVAAAAGGSEFIVPAHQVRVCAFEREAGRRGSRPVNCICIKRYTRVETLVAVVDAKATKKKRTFWFFFFHGDDDAGLRWLLLLDVVKFMEWSSSGFMKWRYFLGYYQKIFIWKFLNN